MTMGTSTQRGFTIIEVTLFLAISGLLIIGLFLAVGASLNTQRYRDSIQSFKSLLQAQYAELANTQNSRSNAWDCNGLSAQTTSSGSVFRGQSNCILLGKYMRIDGGDITIYTVVAAEKAIVNRGLTDISALLSTGNYRINVSSSDVKTTSLEWGTRIAWPASGSGSRSPRDRTMGILFIRSPDSGQTYTFTSNDLVTVGTTGVSAGAFDTMLVNLDAIPGRQARTICIVSDGLGQQGGDMAVFIRSYANSAGAIETRSNQFMKDNTGANPSQC